MKNSGRKLWVWCTLSVCLLVVCFCTVRDISLERMQHRTLAVLDERAGEYDEHSIVLTGTNVGRANELAERFSARLRITEDGSFATLTLPEGMTIRDVASDEDNRAILDELSVDYHASISTSADGAAEIAYNGRHHHKRPRYTVTDQGYGSQD